MPVNSKKLTKVEGGAWPGATWAKWAWWESERNR